MPFHHLAHGLAFSATAELALKVKNSKNIRKNRLLQKLYV